MSNTTTRLVNDDKYERPKKTLQEKLSDIEIQEKLENYVQVDDISTVQIKTHLRYFKLEGKKKSFRLGGILINKDNADKYVVLSNGSFTWSADVKKSIYFRKITIEELRESYDEEIDKYKKQIKKLKKQLKEK